MDILRGVAIFGVLLMSLLAHARYEPPGFGEATDFIVANKALSLLSMLFGIGFGVQMFRAGARGASFIWVYLRRMAVLFLLGAAHWLLGWNSILTSYAVIGCTLLPLRKLSARGMLVAAGLLLVMLQFQTPILQSIPRLLGRNESQMKANRQARQQLNQRMASARQSGSYAEFVQVQAEVFRSSHSGLLQWIRLIFPAYYLPMALLGLSVVKSGWLDDLSARDANLRVLMWCALAAGLASNPLPYLPLGKLPVPAWGYRLSFLISGPSMALFYASVIALAVRTRRGYKVLSWLRWPGRMALTNYVLQSACIVIICYGFGFGLMKKLTVPEVWGIAVVLFFLIAVLSAAWLRRFEFGPLEWLWRILTYGRPGMRRPPAGSVTAKG